MTVQPATPIVPDFNAIITGLSLMSYPQFSDLDNPNKLNNPKKLDHPDRIDVDEFAFTFSVNIRIGAIALMIAGALTAIYSQLDEKQRDVANFGTTTLGVCIAGASAIHAYRGLIRSAKVQEAEIRASRAEIIASRQERNLDRDNEQRVRVLDRTINYIARWNHPDFASSRATMKKVLLDSNKQNIKLATYLDAHPEEAQAVVSILNFLEELSFLTHEKDLDKDKLASFYRAIFDMVYSDFFQYIQARREEKNRDKLYEHFEKLHQEWQINGGYRG
ncbi:MAG: DUF4760 domain-containing protein [Cyanothece sp. SIO2G6]|nr:DUF4760 domain-containing protein [Cyanothece sp. SIO2G6]